MTYRSVRELPEDIREGLPENAQSIYRSAYNSAFKQYDGDAHLAHTVAWSAIEDRYWQDGRSGKWYHR